MNFKGDFGTRYRRERKLYQVPVLLFCVPGTIMSAKIDFFTFMVREGI